MRFNQLDYSSDSPVVKESSIKFFGLPNLQELKLLQIKESILKR